MKNEKRTKIKYNAEEATQLILDLPSDSDMSDLDELSVDEDLNLSEDQNTNVRNEDREHHSDTEKRLIFHEIL